VARPLLPAVSPAFPLSWSSEVFERTSTAVVSVRGELDRITAPALRDHVEWLLAGDCRRLVLDAGAVTFADAGAFELLRDLGTRGRADGCAIVVTSPGEPLRRLLVVLGTPPGITLEQW
jgi:anti-anti-sigma factor